MRTRFEEFLKENDAANVSPTIGMTGVGSAVSGYPLNNAVDPSGIVYGGNFTNYDGGEQTPSYGSDALSPKKPFSLFTNIKRKRNKRNKADRLHNQIGKDIDTLYEPVRKVAEGVEHSEHFTLAVEVKDMKELHRVKEQIEKITELYFSYNETIETLSLFPNWLFIELSYKDKSVYMNYWNDEGDYESNFSQVRNEMRTGVGSSQNKDPHIYTESETVPLLRKIREFFNIPEAPSYVPRKRMYEENDWTEGSAYTGIVGSGMNVGGGAEGSFVKSAGQALNGWDSGSAMGKNSNNSIDNVGNAYTKRTEPQPIFKQTRNKHKKKMKEARLYNKLGKEIAGIYRGRPKMTNEGGGWGNEKQHDKSMSKLILKFKKHSKKVIKANDENMGGI